VTLFPISYTKNELGYLANCLWGKQNSEEKAFIAMLIRCTLDSDCFMRCMLPREQAIFQMPFEDVPLYINDENSWIRDIVRWRLEINR